MTRRGKKKVTQEAILQVHEMRRRGVRYEDIAKRLEMSVGSVRNAIKSPRPTLNHTATKASTRDRIATAIALVKEVKASKLPAEEPADEGCELFTGDASLVVANAKSEIAQVDGDLGALLAKHDALEVFLGFHDEGLDARGQRRATGGRYENICLALASPTSLATLALYATEDVRNGREDGEGDDEHAAFLEAHEADHLARARILLRDAIASIPAVHASSFTVRTEEKAP